MKVFVYGATGTVGSGLVQLLLAKGHSVFAGSRNPENGKKLANLKWIQVDISIPHSGLESLGDGMDALYLLSPPGYADQFSVLSPWIDQAKKSGVKKVTLMTAMGVDMAPAEAPLRKLELKLENSGLNYVILRPNWFMQNFHTFWLAGILNDHKIYFPGGDGKTSFIDTKDISATALAVIENNDIKNTAFTLTGKEALTHTEVAKIISKTTGLDIAYADISPEEFKKGLLSVGIPEDYTDFLVMIAGALKAGYSSAITDEVKKLTGKDPHSFEEYAKENRSNWMG